MEVETIRKEFNYVEPPKELYSYSEFKRVESILLFIHRHRKKSVKAYLNLRKRTITKKESNYIHSKTKAAEIKRAIRTSNSEEYHKILNDRIKNEKAQIKDWLHLLKSYNRRYERTA